MRESHFETLLIEYPEPHLMVVRLNRPQLANALNTQMGRELHAVWTDITADPGEVRCIILAAAGGGAFCAGGDLKERLGMSDAAWRAQHEIFERAYWSMLDCPLPIIAAVSGHAYAGGLEMVLAADFAYGVAEARFALTEVAIGIMPGAGGTQTLPRIVGERRAKEIILTARPFSAQEALSWGILNRVLSSREELWQAVLETARTIAANAPLSVRQAKKAIHFGLQMDIRTALRFEVECYNYLIGTEDRREGIASFNEKRRPLFRGR